METGFHLALSLWTFQPWIHCYLAHAVLRETSVLQGLNGVPPILGSLPFLTPGSCDTLLFRNASQKVRTEPTTSEAEHLLKTLKTHMDDQASEWQCFKAEALTIFFILESSGQL